MRIAALFVALALSAGAALADELKIDGSTSDTTSTSIQAIYGQHSHREVCLLQAAIINIAVGEKDKREAAGADKNAPAPDIGTFINGMTYDEIIDKSHQYPSKVMALCRD